MDHEKKEAVSPQVYEYGEQHNSLVMSDLSPDNSETLFGPTPSINEADNVEDRRERRGESLWLVSQYAPVVGRLLIHRQESTE